MFFTDSGIYRRRLLFIVSFSNEHHHRPLILIVYLSIYLSISAVDGPQSGVTLTYTAGEVACDGQSNRRATVIYLLCDRTNQGIGQLFNTITRLSGGVYYAKYYISSQYACPKA